MLSVREASPRLGREAYAMRGLQSGGSFAKKEEADRTAVRARVLRWHDTRRQRTDEGSQEADGEIHPDMPPTAYGRMKAREYWEAQGVKTE